ncbi:MAG: hypothetical protein MJK14_05500 [Rivularia sp. ALOHA_DT_140]|nr:hypothetical protein [Rivularia sp. ALOHA_DT_140]
MRLINLGIASLVMTLASLTIAVNPASAAVIDFESGFSDGDSVGTVTGSDGNQVTFSIGPNDNNRSDAEIAEKGRPVTAFASLRFRRGRFRVRQPDGQGTNYSNRSGDFMLTDGITQINNYYIQFSKAVTSFNFDFLGRSKK